MFWPSGISPTAVLFYLLSPAQGGFVSLRHLLAHHQFYFMVFIYSVVIAAPKIHTHATSGSVTANLFFGLFFCLKALLKSGKFLWPRSSKIWFGLTLEQQERQSTGSPHGLDLPFPKPFSISKSFPVEFFFPEAGIGLTGVGFHKLLSDLLDGPCVFSQTPQNWNIWE